MGCQYAFSFVGSVLYTFSEMTYSMPVIRASGLLPSKSTHLVEMHNQSSWTDEDTFWRNHYRGRP